MFNEAVEDGDSYEILHVSETTKFTGTVALCMVLFGQLELPYKLVQDNRLGGQLFAGGGRLLGGGRIALHHFGNLDCGTDQSAVLERIH